MTTDASSSLTRSTFVAMVDHTLLKPEATAAQIAAICDEALLLNTAAVCVNSYWVPVVASHLAGSDVDVCSVVGFPLGAMSTAALTAETTKAVDDGAVEVDMVLPLGVYRSDRSAAGDYIAACRRAAGDGTTLKVILETALLTDAEITDACHLAVEHGADFVKTSTGFNPAGGATAEAVALMRAAVGPSNGVKASGGIRTLDDVKTMVDAGADRLGMSATLAVLEQLASD